MTNTLTYKGFYRRFLPHLQPVDAYFFVTYRLAFTLPQHVKLQLAQKIQECERLSKNLPTRQRQEFHQTYWKRLFAIEDHFLNTCTEGPHWLQIDTIAELVLNNWYFHHTKRYELVCALLMSNHAHILMKPLLRAEKTPYSLAEIMHGHKSYTAHQANQILQRTGAFWFPESYDHYVRDEDEFFKIIQYILNNPVKSGLVQDVRTWKYYWVNPTYITLP